MNFFFLFSELDDRGLILRNLLDVSLPSVCGIFKSGPSGTLQLCGREVEGVEKGAVLQLRRCCHP